jgi:hypothetical protein
MTTAMVVNASTIVTVDLIDEITMTVDPILAMTMWIDVKIHDLCVGLNSQSPSPGKIIGFTSPTPEPIRR